VTLRQQLSRKHRSTLSSMGLRIQQVGAEILGRCQLRSKISSPIMAYLLALVTAAGQRENNDSSTLEQANQAGPKALAQQ
jgi:hypothetical protein